MKKYLLLVFLAAAFSFEGSAQSQQAILTEDGTIALDKTVPLTDHYQLSTAAFNFESQQEALDYFAHIDAEFIAMRPITQDGVVHIYLQRKQKPDWTIEDWNTYTNEVLNSNKALKSKLTNQ